MEHHSLYRDNNDYYTLLTFKEEEIVSFCELSLEDFGSHLSLEQWQSILRDNALVVNSERDKHAIYLLQLGCASIIAPIRQQFMKVYVGIARNTAKRV